MMPIDRAEAIGRAERALKALGEHPRSSKKELGHAREQLNACYAVEDRDPVWDAVATVETMAARRYGVPQLDEQAGSQNPAVSAGARPTKNAVLTPTMAASAKAPGCHQSESDGAEIAMRDDRTPVGRHKPGAVGSAAF